MPYSIVLHGVAVTCDTPAEVRDLLPPPSTLREAIAAEEAKPIARKKPGPKPRVREADVLTPEQKAKLAAEVPLICRKPHGCGQPFESKNRMAWYCPKCQAKRDEGRPV